MSKAQELVYASRHVTAIEINSTFYRLQKPAVFAKWHDATPASFMFCVKAPRFIVQRSDLTTAGSGVERFIQSGIAELKSKLGPLLWQLAPAKSFNADEIRGFLSLLPAAAGKVPLRHAIEVRHASFLDPAFLAIARRHNVAVVLADGAAHPAIADLTSTFVYARLRRSAAGCATGYTLPALKQWCQHAQVWAQGGAPEDLTLVDPAHKAAGSPRDVFIFFINGAKERAPAAAQKLISLLS